jgi:hypothetical protein
MLASFAMVASAADFEFEFALLDADMENEVTEVNVGDKVYLTIDCSTKTAKYGFEINIDTTVFEVATFEEDGATYDDFDSGNHVGVFVINPNGAANTMAFTGAKTGATKAISNTIGLIAKAAGSYEISFKQIQAQNMPSGAAGSGANSIALTVKGNEPAEFDVTYAANDLVVWGNKPATTTDKVVKFEATPAFGYMITEVNGEAVANTAGGEYEVTLTEATEIAVTVAAIDTKVIATKYVDGSKAYIFGKANFAAGAYGVAVEINGAVVNDPANGVADGKYAATANANGAFGVAFDVTGKVFKGDWSVKAYADAEESAAVTFAIN